VRKCARRLVPGVERLARGWLLRLPAEADAVRRRFWVRSGGRLWCSGGSCWLQRKNWRALAAQCKEKAKSRRPTRGVRVRAAMRRQLGSAGRGESPNCHGLERLWAWGGWGGTLKGSKRRMAGRRGGRRGNNGREVGTDMQPNARRRAENEQGQSDARSPHEAAGKSVTRKRGSWREGGSSAGLGGRSRTSAPTTARAATVALAPETGGGDSE